MVKYLWLQKKPAWKTGPIFSAAVSELPKSTRKRGPCAPGARSGVVFRPGRRAEAAVHFHGGENKLTELFSPPPAAERRN